MDDLPPTLGRRSEQSISSASQALTPPRFPSPSPPPVQRFPVLLDPERTLSSSNDNTTATRQAATPKGKPCRHPTLLKPNSALTMLVSILWWTYITLHSFFIGYPLALVCRTVHIFHDNKQRKLLHRWTTIWALHYNHWNPFVKNTTVKGLENLQLVRQGKPGIFVCNHQSALDIFLLYTLSSTGVHFKWVSKSSNFYIPLIGWAMPLNDYIPVTRGKKDSVLKMFSHCKTHLSNRNSVLFFPEGSRNTEGGLKFFKPDAFTLVFKISSFHFQ